jgi:hypothetical protein
MKPHTGGLTPASLESLPPTSPCGRYKAREATSPRPSTARKCLFASPVGQAGKEYIRKIVERFGHESFDFLLMVYDDSRYDEPCFNGCAIVHDPSPLFWQLKRNLTPELCRQYEYVFLWMDDLDILDFDPDNFLRIVREHRIQVAQPALSQDSVVSHRITVRQDTPIGRYTDFVEQMAMTFRGNLWERFWRIIRSDSNPWGWGYDEFTYAAGRFRRMAIIDAETIRHVRGGSYHGAARAGQLETWKRHGHLYRTRKRVLGRISTEPWQKHVVIPWRLLRHRTFVGLYASLPAFLLRRVIRKHARGPLATMPAK